MPHKLGMCPIIALEVDLRQKQRVVRTRIDRLKNGEFSLGQALQCVHISMMVILMCDNDVGIGKDRKKRWNTMKSKLRT